MAITASLVKELRERTGAPMMKCKKFLEEAGGDIEKAIEKMREADPKQAAKKAGRITAEGIVITNVSDDGKSGTILEVNCETDFVTRNEDFLNFANEVAQRALAVKANDVAMLGEQALVEGQAASIEQARQDLVAKIGENINLRRVAYIESDDIVANYVHGSRIGVIVGLKGASSQLGKDIAMHIAASNPVVVSPDQVPADLVNKEKEIYSAQAKESGKPQEIIEKMIQGRLNKFLDEVSLEGQPFVKDPDSKVGKLLKDAGASVTGFIRYEVGEGIEKKQEDFAAEVMAQVRGSE